MVNYLRKFWWLWAIVGLLIIVWGLPQLGFGIFAMHPPDTFKAGDCYEGFCLTKCYAAGDIRPYWCSAEGSCRIDSDCTDLVIDSEVQPASSNTNQPVTNSAGDVADASEISCKDDKLYKGSAVWDDCEGNGCHMIKGKAVCKTVAKGKTDWFGWLSDEQIEGVPNYLLILAAVFILLMASMAGRRQ